VAGRGGRVALGVDGQRVLGGADEPRARPGRVARAQPVGCDLHALATARLERLGELAMESAAAQPRHVGVERLPAQRVAEAHAAVAEIVEDAVALQLGEPLLGREPGDQLGGERLACDGRRLGRGPRRLRQRRGAHQHGVADGVGHRHVTVVAELEPAPAGLQPAADRQGAGELLDDERDALRAVVERAHERR
jgi:hypothetical protein